MLLAVKEWLAKHCHFTQNPPGRGSERYRLWLLKNSFAIEPLEFRNKTHPNQGLQAVDSLTINVQFTNSAATILSPRGIPSLRSNFHARWSHANCDSFSADPDLSARA